MKILLSSPLAPLPSFVNGRDNLHSNYANTTYGQDIFSIPTETHAYGLHLIAQNIAAETTLLENPTVDDFTREAGRGYDFVGIHFLIPFFSKVLEMCRIVRRLAPHSRIVLGGHGVQGFSHSTGQEDELLALADHVCRGDGVRFFRALLEQDVDAPIVQELPLNAVVPFRMGFLRQEAPVLLSALGCTNQCEFCASSAFFGGKRIPLADPGQLFEAIKNYLRKYEFSTANIYDDNFLMDKDYVLELGRLIRDDALCQDKDFGYYTFANLAAIAKYDYEELVAAGVRGLLIGVESKFKESLDRNTARKMSGIDRREVFRSLMDHGIRIDGSMLLGWDFHDHETIVEDIDYYVSLGATSDQIVPIIPVPETALWSRLAAEGRLSDDISWDEGGFYTTWMRYKNLEAEEVWEYEDLALRTAYETWGPTYLRTMDLSLRGYRRFKDHADPYLRRKAKFHERRCQALYPLLLCIRTYAPSTRVRALVDDLKRAFAEEFGRPTVKQELVSLAGLAIGTYRKLHSRLFREDTVQPKSQTYRYSPGERARLVLRR